MSVWVAQICYGTTPCAKILVHQLPHVSQMMHCYYLNSAMLYQRPILKTISHPHLLEQLHHSGFIWSLVPRRLIMTRQPSRVSLICRYFPNLTMLYPVPDVEDQHAQPPSTTEHSFPVIVVDSAYDPLLMDELKNLKAPILTHFCKDLATMVWNRMFHESIARLPTADTCWILITRACDRELIFNPTWEPERGTLYCLSLFILSINTTLSANNQ